MNNIHVYELTWNNWWPYNADNGFFCSQESRFFYSTHNGSYKILWPNISQNNPKLSIFVLLPSLHHLPETKKAQGWSPSARADWGRLTLNLFVSGFLFSMAGLPFVYPENDSTLLRNSCQEKSFISLTFLFGIHLLGLIFTLHDVLVHKLPDRWSG